MNKYMAALSSIATANSDEIIQWKLRNDYGVNQIINVKVFYIPNISVTAYLILFLEQQTKKSLIKASFYLHTNGIILTFTNGKF